MSCLLKSWSRKHREHREQSAHALREGGREPHQLQHLAPPPWGHVPPPALSHQLEMLFGFGMPRKAQMFLQSLPQFCTHAPGSPLVFWQRPAHAAKTRLAPINTTHE